MIVDELVFDTRYREDGRFDYVSSGFSPEHAAGVLLWMVRRELLGVVMVREVDGVAVMHSSRRYATREDAESAMADFLELAKRNRGALM